jgi:hypothetical protein
MRVRTAAGACALMAALFAISACTSTHRYQGVAALAQVRATLGWTKTGSAARGTIEFSDGAQQYLEIAPGKYPITLTFNGDSFTGGFPAPSGSVPVSGSTSLPMQTVQVSGSVTPTGVDLILHEADGRQASLHFTSVSGGGYGYSGYPLPS